MPRTIKVAALQMDTSPAPTADRLVTEAAETGAHLVILPGILLGRRQPR